MTTLTTLFVAFLIGGIPAWFGAVHAQDNKEPHSTGVSIQGHKAVMTMLNSRGDAATTGSNGPQTASDDRKFAMPSQQPAMASPPKREGQANDAPPISRFAAANATWQQTASSAEFHPQGSVRLLSPLCTGGTEATTCAAFSGNTAVVVSSVFPAIGIYTNVKTTQCFCDFRNTVHASLPASSIEVYRCAVYCQ